MHIPYCVLSAPTPLLLLLYYVYYYAYYGLVHTSPSTVLHSTAIALASGSLFEPALQLAVRLVATLSTNDAPAKISALCTTRLASLIDRRGRAETFTPLTSPLNTLATDALARG